MNTELNLQSLKEILVEQSSRKWFSTIKNKNRFTPPDGGVAIEYKLAISLSSRLNIPLYFNDLKSKIAVSTLQKEANKTLFAKYLAAEEKANKDRPIKKSQKKIKESIEKIIKKDEEAVENLVTKIIESVKQETFFKILLYGKSGAGETSGDIFFIRNNKETNFNNLSEQEKYGISVKSSSDKIYQTSLEQISPEKDIETNISGSPSIEDPGGGIYKLYKAFNLDIPDHLFTNDTEIYKQFSELMNKKYEENVNEKDMELYFTQLVKIIQRADPTIEMLVTVKSGDIVYPKLLQQSFKYVKSIKHFELEKARPEIQSRIIKIDSISLINNKTFDKKFEEKVKKTINQSKEQYENFYSLYKNLEKKETKDKIDSFFNSTLQISPTGDFSIFFKKLEDYINNIFTSALNVPLFSVRRVYRENKTKDGYYPADNYIEKKRGVQILSDLFYFFNTLESEKMFIDLTDSIKNLFNLQDSLQKQGLMESINNFIIHEYNKLLLENKNKQNILNKIKKKINSLDKKDLGIVSITPSNKSDAAIVVRCEDKENIESVRSAVKSSIDSMGLSTNNRVIAKFEPSTESTEIKMNDGSGGVYIVYKYDIGSREGLALEHIMGLLLTKKVTPELKNRLDLPPEASKEEVKEKLKTQYSDVLSTALEGKKLIDQKIGEITEARSEGSRNSKADLILTTADGHTYGLSIKLVTEEGREVRFTYNKNLGYGDDDEETLVKSPNGKPWWLIGRQNFAKKLGRQFKGNPEDLEPPGWMTKAKESKSDLYKEAMEETYASLREVFVNNLKRMKLKELVEMVNEAHNGGEQEEEYEKLFVLTSDADGIRLESKGHEEPDIEKIKMSGMKKSDIVKTDGARIIIDIPGMSPLTIHGLKFHSNMLSSNREDLKIKTR